MADILQPGSAFGVYNVVKILGKGAMGAVYLLEYPQTKALYAAKIMTAPPDEDKPGEWLSRFKHEAEFAMSIRHPGIIGVYDAGQDPDSGLCYMLMDYLPGGTLADRLKKNGKLSIKESVWITLNVAAALEAAHRRGVVHRDVKPENILFDADGKPKLSDLGIARFGSETVTNVTSTDMIIGTPAYMSPEQMMNSHDVDARADIYSLGVVFYEMLTGTRPRAGSTVVELMAKAIKGEELPDIRSVRPDVPASIAHILSMMVSIKPEKRPETAGKAVNLLSAAVAGKKLPSGKFFKRAVKSIPWIFLAAAVATTSFIAVRKIGVGKTVETPPATLRQELAQEPAPAPVPEPVRFAPDSSLRFTEIGGVKWIWTLKEDGAALWRGEDERHGLPCLEPCPQGKVVVPDAVDGIPVVELGPLAFKDCGEMTEVELPATLKRIGNRAFMNCHRLEKIALPESVESLGLWAFNSCHSLKQADLGMCASFARGGIFSFSPMLERILVSENNKSFVSRDGILYSRDGKTLVECPPSVKTLAVPDGVETIREFAFVFGRLEKIKFPKSLKKIEGAAFRGCRNLKIMAFSSDAPVLEPNEFHPFLEISGDLRIYVPEGSKGWNKNGPPGLPGTWPEGDWARKVVPYDPRGDLNANRQTNQRKN